MEFERHSGGMIVMECGLMWIGLISVVVVGGGFEWGFGWMASVQRGACWRGLARGEVP